MVERKCNRAHSHVVCHPFLWPHPIFSWRSWGLWLLSYPTPVRLAIWRVDRCWRRRGMGLLERSLWTSTRDDAEEDQQFPDSVADRSSDLGVVEETAAGAQRCQTLVRFGSGPRSVGQLAGTRSVVQLDQDLRQLWRRFVFGVKLYTLYTNFTEAVDIWLK